MRSNCDQAVLLSTSMSWSATVKWLNGRPRPGGTHLFNVSIRPFCVTSVPASLSRAINVSNPQRSTCSNSIERGEEAGSL